MKLVGLAILGMAACVVMSCGGSSTTCTIIGDAVGGDTVAGDGDVAAEAAPDAEPDAPQTDGEEAGEVVEGGFGAPCLNNSDCDSGFCIEGVDGFVCTKACGETCPEGWACRAVLFGADLVSLCVPLGVSLCKPCKLDSQCGDGLCLPIGGGTYCGLDCSSSDCPAGYECKDVPIPDDGTAKQCLPKSGACDCNAALDGTQRPCVRKGDGGGTCLGFETCDANQGWIDCSAPAPKPEECNGVDDDCNGLADDLPTKPTDTCEIEVPTVGSCPGTWLCQGTDGWKCVGNPPKAESCNYVDDDCNGTTDDDFRNGDGKYFLKDHCGQCGNTCEGKLPFAAKVDCDASGADPVCVVVECQQGYVKIGPQACGLPVSSLCVACAADADCGPSGKDLCLQLGSAKACARDCSAMSPFGTSCPDGYACQDQGGGAAQCVPATGTCDCVPANAGLKRVCSKTNGQDKCLGTETCDAALGWVGCTAATPTAEVCDGLDNDCDGFVDDALAPPPDPCEESWTDPDTGKTYTCTGTWACAEGGEGKTWVCPARTPEKERCNFLDDNCDGQTDEGFPAIGSICFEGTGACQAVGILQCNAAGDGVVCSAKANPGTTEICDGADNDCDGAIDEDFPKKDEPCKAGLGVCERAGVLECTLDGTGLECNAVPGPVAAETCNGLDDDCNGVVDDPWPDRNTVCVVGTGVCAAAGVWSCKADGTGIECSAKAGAGGAEACNYLDDNCDGATDEPFKTGGRYVADATCGNCFTDCTVLWTSAVHHAKGVCDAVPAMPVCTYVCDEGWADPDHHPDNGCEMPLDPTAVYVATPINGGSDADGCGGWQAPCATIGHGLAVATAGAGAKTKVLVSEGIYTEDVTLVEGIDLLGGHSSVTWERDPDVSVTVIAGTTPAGASSRHRKAVVAEGIVAPTEFSGFTVYGENNFLTPPGEAAGNSYGVWVRNCGPGLAIRDNVVFAGRGAAGGPGVTGGQGGNGGPGGPGADGYDTGTTTCSTSTNPGGAGGASTCGAAGGAGGTGHCPHNNDQEPAGGAGQGLAGGAGGVGGYDASVSNDAKCISPVYASGTTKFGQFGKAGSDGASGASGAGCAVAAGSVAGGEWVGDPGLPGVTGTAGSGGGGGGSGGGVDIGNTVNCQDKDTLGGAGGGGGAGGCGGTAGTGGMSGGGSFALFLVWDAVGAPAGLPAVEGNLLMRNHGGDGGPGGIGGTGGAGGKGGSGGDVAGLYFEFAAGIGGFGGAGGFGGHGGGGGGGCGGGSYGIYVSAPAGLAGYCLPAAANQFGAVGEAGAGGPGGASAGSPGAAGAAGAAADCLAP